MEDFYQLFQYVLISAMFKLQNQLELILHTLGLYHVFKYFLFVLSVQVFKPPHSRHIS